MKDPQSWTRLADIPRKRDLVVNPPRFEGLMCGIAYATIQRDGTTTLVYTDQTRETAQLREDEIFPINTFRLTSAVQSRRM